MRKGQNIYYSLNTTVFQALLGWLLDVTGVESNDDSGDTIEQENTCQRKEQLKDGKGSVASVSKN